MDSFIRLTKSTTWNNGGRMTPNQYLSGLREGIPEWLNDFTAQTRFQGKEFFKSRIVYYPGSGTDGQPVKLFGGSHSSHCFVFADYGMAQTEIEQQLADPHHGFRGYHTLARLQLNEHDLFSSKWIPHVPAKGIPHFAKTGNSPFGFLEVLERNTELDDSHGARKLAILFLGADGIASYDALFCQEHSEAPPFAVVLQDHGYGGNYDRFGRGGLLSSIANQCNVFPTFLVVGGNTEPWEGFSRIEDLEPDKGGMHNNQRYLYKRDIRGF